MDARPAVGFFLGLGAIFAGGAAARLLLDDTLSGASLLSLVIAIAAVAQAVAAVAMVKGLRHAEEQARAAQRSVELIQENSERQLRAYLDIESASLAFDSSGEVTLVVVFKNSGQTPARSAQAAYRYDWMPPHEYNPPPELSPEGSSRDVASDGRYTFRTHVDQARWREHYAAVSAGTMRFVVVGRLAYRDVFGVERLTLFRRFLQPSAHATELATATGGNSST